MDDEVIHSWEFGYNLMSLSLELRNLHLRFWKDRKLHAVPGTFSNWESHLLKSLKEGQDCTQNSQNFHTMTFTQ